MAKISKLTQNFINLTKFIKKSTNPLFSYVVKRDTLSNSDLYIAGTALPSVAEMKLDTEAVKRYYLKVNNAGKNVRDEANIYDTIQVNIYEWNNIGSEVSVPDQVFTELSTKGIIEEVI